ncbi:hypothetical protein [Flavobacterium sp. M31R6]|uniref:hypothetical protein n=1 Tax=Flavobacterium sp. M31R6 TaxID=2739062 RepID=UPI0015694DCD|nr:hypothetical protein [Flavobacterium sp. M31R6]QKJ64144.1 hypothetical protein HQN62_13725 [Flavobacterium sp. M31R6]
MKPRKKEIYPTIIIILMNILIVGMVFLLNFLISSLNKIEFLFLKIITYLIICTIAFQINKKYNNLLAKIIANIIYLPITILVIFAVIAIPILSVQLSVFLYLAFSFLIPIIAYLIDDYYQLTILNVETWIYIIITLGIFIAILFHKYLKFLIDKIISILNLNSTRVQNYKLIELNNFVISLKNIRFTLFFLYLLYLIITNLLSLQHKSFYENPNIDLAVLQSFVTFLAIDRVLAKIKQIKFSPSKLLEILKNSFNQIKKNKNLL